MAEKLILDIQAEVANAKKRIKSLETGVKGVNKEVGKSDKLFQKAAGTMAALFSVAAVIGFTKQIIAVRAEFEKYNAVLKNTLGSAQAANIEFARIQKFASETPFSIRELTNAFVKLVNQGFKPSTVELRKLGDLAASTGKTFDQLTEAIIDATVGEFERLKEFGIRAQKSGNQVKFTFKEVETQVKFTSEAIRDYILSLGDLEGVSGAMAGISETLGGRISNLGDAWDTLLDTLGGRTGGIFKFVITTLNSMIQAMDNASKSTHELREEVALMQLGAEQELSLDEFLKFIEVAKEEGETYAEVAAQFLEIDKQRLKTFPELTEEAEKLLEAFGVTDPKTMLDDEEYLQRELLRIRINTIEKFAREEDLKEQARLNKRLDEEFKTAQKVAKAWNQSFSQIMTDAENFAQAAADGNDIFVDKLLADLQRTTDANERALQQQSDDSEDAAKNQLAIEKFLQQQKVSMITTGFRFAQAATSEHAGTQKLLAIAESIISTFLTAQLQAQALAPLGPVAAEAARAEAIVAGLLNTAMIAGVALFGGGGFTGKSKLDPGLSDKSGRIAGLVHEDEFVFNKQKTSVLRPLFEDIHNDRIDARGLAALTRRGVILPMVQNNFNSKVLENEVGKIYRQMKEKDPERWIQKTEKGYIKKVGNTIITAN